EREIIPLLIRGSRVIVGEHQLAPRNIQIRMHDQVLRPWRKVLGMHGSVCDDLRFLQPEHVSIKINDFPRISVKDQVRIQCQGQTTPSTSCPNSTIRASGNANEAVTEASESGPAAVPPSLLFPS